MANKWIIGVITIYMAILLATTIANQANQFTTETVTALTAMAQPTGSEMATNTSNISMISKVWSYVVVFFQAFFLWSPTLWSGSWIWFYYFFCLPITLSMVYGVVSMLRGNV